MICNKGFTSLNHIAIKIVRIYDMEVKCEKCGSRFELTYNSVISRDKDYIRCSVCHDVLYEWDEAKIYTANLIEKKELHIQ